MRRSDQSAATRRTVIVAGVANLVVGLAKLVAGRLPLQAHVFIDPTQGSQPASPSSPSSPASRART